MAGSLPAEIVRLQRQLAQVEKGSRIAHGASVENAAILVNDAAGSIRTIVGLQGDGTVGVQAVNGPPPPQPSAPIAVSVLGGVAVSWDGLFANGAVIPMDWQRVEVHASIVAIYDPIPATLVTTIETAQGATVIVPCDTPVYVRLVARSASGTASVPSAATGPFGPSPVVATDILDGIVTTLKLADDAVTQAKVATGAIGTTEISDNAITTPKIVAAAVQAAQIDAEAVNASKLAAGSVTTAKLDALAVTADKIAANAITVGKINAGAVDATALAADAITGKTITGGTITGSVLQTAATGERVTINEAGANKVLVYDGVAPSAIGELSGRGLLLEGTNGSIIWLDPDNTYPNLRFTNAASTNEAVINVVETSPGAADLGLNSGTFTGSGFTDMKWRTFMGADFWVAERVRDSASSTSIGGRVLMNSTSGSVGFRDTTDPTKDAALTVQQGWAYTTGARFHVIPPASALSALFVDVPTGHTGNLVRAALNNVDKFKVDKDGNTNVEGILSARNIVTGTVNIIPSAAHTPTSISITFPTVPGTTFRGYATAITTVPGSRTAATPSGAGVTGVAMSSVTATSGLVWVNRENTTSTTVNWMVIGS